MTMASGDGTGAGGGTEARVSVVVPTFNNAHLLEECLRSLLAQTFAEWEAVVVDDGSPDGAQIDKALAKLSDRRLRLVRHVHNAGVAAARNTGCREAVADLLLPLDADDALAPDALEKLVAVLDAEPELDAVHPDVQRFARRRDVAPPAGPGPDGRVLFLHQAPPIGALMRRALWQRVGGQDEHAVLRHGREGFEFWVRTAAHGCRLRHLAEPLYRHRVSHWQKDDECRQHEAEIADYVYRKHRALYDAAGAGAAMRAFFYQRAAIACYEQGQAARARRLALRALRLVPDRAHLKTLVRSLLPRPLHRAWRRGELRRLVPLAGYPLLGRQRYRPFFVIGVARSGNTLFRRILTAHSELHIPPETFVLGQCIQKFRRLGRRLSWPDLVALIYAEFEFHPEFHTFDLWLGPLVERLKRAPLERRNLAYLLDSFFRYHGEQHGESFQRWGDKTPMNALDDALITGDWPRELGRGVPETLERLRAVFPDAQFLHIQRDGCDVAYSFLRGSFVADVEEAGRRWVHTVRQCRRFVRRHPGQCFELRYEDLIAEPAPLVQGVCGFLGVEFEPAMLASHGSTGGLGDIPEWSWHKQVAQPINARNTGKGRTFFSRSDRERLQRIIGADLAELGYRPATADPVAVPSSA